MKKTKAKKSGKNTFIPRAAAAVIPRLTLECIDKYELLLCGCKKIEAYSPTETLLAASSCRVRICGEKLSIAFTGDSKIMLSGIISEIKFE